MYSNSTYSSSVDSLSHLSTYTSDTIMTNVPGPGRTVGHLWGKVANWVEKKVLVVAHKQGLGLNAVRERINRCLEESVGDKCPWTLSEHEALLITDQIRADCAKVGGYASCRSGPTEGMALEYIIELVTQYPFMRKLFNDRDFGVHDKLKTVKNSDPNKISHEIQQRRVLSSRALLCIEDNAIAKLVRTVQGTDPPQSSANTEEEKRKAIVKLLSMKKSRKNPEKQNVAIHFAGHLLSHARTCQQHHIKPTEDFICNACRAAVDKLLDTKHSQFSVERPLEESCIALLEMIKEDNTPLPQTEGHPIRNMLAFLQSTSSKDMYPDACSKASEVSRHKKEKFPKNDYYTGPSYYYDTDMPPRRSRRRRGKHSQAKA